MIDPAPKMPRRDFLDSAVRKLPAWLLLFKVIDPAELLGDGDSTDAGSAKYDPTQHDYAMGVAVHKCIGCGRCADACKTENDVPLSPSTTR